MKGNSISMLPSVQLCLPTAASLYSPTLQSNCKS